MNRLDDIKLPDNIDDVIDNGIDRAFKEREKRKSKRGKKILTSVAAGLAITFTIGVMNPALASKIPIIGGVFENIQDNIGFSGDYSKYATSVNQTVNSGDLGVTLSEVLCDGQSLYVTFKVESKIPFKYTKYKYDPIKDYDITKEKAEEIVGVQIIDDSSSKVSFTDKELDNSGVAGFEGRYIDDKTFIGVEKYDLSNLGEIPDEFKYEIKIKSLSSRAWDSEDKDQIFKGKWNFKVPVKVDRSLTKEIDVNYTEDGIGINKIVITPFEIKIETTHSKKMKVLGYYIDAKDDKGNKLNLDNQRWEDERSITTFARQGLNSDKIVLKVYREILEPTWGGYDVIYTKEINIK